MTKQEPGVTKVLENTCSKTNETDDKGEVSLSITGLMSLPTRQGEDRSQMELVIRRRMMNRGVCGDSMQGDSRVAEVVLQTREQEEMSEG